MKKKPKVYFDKDGDMVVVFGKDYDREHCTVTLVHDRGAAITKMRNFFGDRLARFIYHCANVYGDSGYSTTLDEYDVKDCTRYDLVKKLRIKR